jgi:predicted acylesterase/phospholipase RssA
MNYLTISELDTIVFSGGGVKGFSYIGIMMSFFDTFKITVGSHFKTFAGTSVGALFALVSFLDLDTRECLKVFQEIGLDSIFSKDPSCLISAYALNDGKHLETLITNILSLASLGPNTTLKDLREKWPTKRLVVSVIDLMNANTLYLDFENIGDIPVAKAILGSMALPPMFPPVPYGKGKCKILMTDGGLLENSSFALFEPQSTLVVSVTWYIDKSPIQDIATYYARIVSILQLGTHDVQERILSKYPFKIIVDLGDVRVDQTNVNINEIIFAGYRAAAARVDTTNYNPAKFLLKENEEILKSSFLKKF